ncbi:MAG: hypothetical protein J0M17_02315 [Planctomycetes bacterium]|nr:hypothetical protein [Planctomycetota bacterium]
MGSSPPALPRAAFGGPRLRRFVLWSSPVGVAASLIYSIAGGAMFRADVAGDRVKTQVKQTAAELRAAADDPWAAAMRERFAVPTAAQLKQYRTEAAAAVKALSTQAGELADGAIQRNRYGLVELTALLKAKQPDAAKLRVLVTALQQVAPPPLEPARRTADAAVARWFAALEWSPEHTAGAEADVAKLIVVKKHLGKPLAPADEAAARLAFRRLAQTRLADDLLADYRGQHSTFNYRTQLSAAYVEQESRRHFSIPVSVRQSAGGFQIGVRGTADADASVDVVLNAEQAEVHVHTTALGRFSVTGTKNRLRLQAANTQHLRASQPLYITADGLVSPGPAVCDRSCTALCWVDACLRLPLVERIVERVAARVAAKKLAEQDPVIANKVEEQARARINDEALDIGHRINGKFGRLTSEHFPDDADKPRLTIASSDEAITWTALYATYAELGTLSPPPDAPARQFDVLSVLHESAVNSWAGRLRGKFLDEATYLALLREHVKIFSPTFDELPPLRSAVVLRFADADPMQVRFEKQGVLLTFRLAGYVLNGRPTFERPKVVEVRYRLAPSPKGLQFVREKENFSGDKNWNEVLARYLPPTIEPAPKFRNASFQSRLALQHVTLGDGWLVTGSNRIEELAAPTISEAQSVAGEEE